MHFNLKIKELYALKISSLRSLFVFFCCNSSLEGPKNGFSCSKDDVSYKTELCNSRIWTHTDQKRPQGSQRLGYNRPIVV